MQTPKGAGFNFRLLSGLIRYKRKFIIVIIIIIDWKPTQAAAVATATEGEQIIIFVSGEGRISLPNDVIMIFIVRITAGGLKFSDCVF